MSVDHLLGDCGHSAIGSAPIEQIKMNVPSEGGSAVGSGMLLVGDGADVLHLARRLDSAGYAVAYVIPADAVGVLGSFHPAVVMVMPGVPTWEKAQLSKAIKARSPDVTVVVLRKRRPLRSLRSVRHDDLPGSIV